MPGKILVSFFMLLLLPAVKSTAAEGKSAIQTGLRTNLLYDAMLIPNAGVEVALGTNWSVALDVKGAWWSSQTHHKSWRYFGCDISGRRYFNIKGVKLSGHHLGAYLQICSYDFRLGEKGYIGGTPSLKIFNHPTLGAGIEYGYTLPVGHSLAFDFSIGLGWAGGQTVEYTTMDRHDVWLRTVNRNWFGPTRAAVSLIYYLDI